MPQPASEKASQQWKENVLKQRESGLSIASWCHQNKIEVHTFYYWRNKLFPKAPLVHSDFKEIQEQQKTYGFQKTGVFIEYQGFCINIDRQFDFSTLKQCLKALKEISC